MHAKIISQENWNSILDSIHHVRKAYNSAKLTDEQRLSEMECHLMAALHEVTGIRAMWEAEATIEKRKGEKA
jgi:hypothetical protein